MFEPQIKVLAAYAAGAALQASGEDRLPFGMDLLIHGRLSFPHRKQHPAQKFAV